jgi:hypothetical protein
LAGTPTTRSRPCSGTRKTTRCCCSSSDPPRRGANGRWSTPHRAAGVRACGCERANGRPEQPRLVRCCWC